MDKCIYCGKLLDNSSEHILQECLGAKWESKSILCKECNKLFGDSIDRMLGEPFVFFRCYLGVRGKRNRIPDLKGIVNGYGVEFIKDGSTGELVKKGQKYVRMENREDGSKVAHIEGDIGNVVRIAEEMMGNLAKKGFTTSDSRYSGYRAEPAGALKTRLVFSLPVFIAIMKSLVNYCRMVLTEGDMERILPLAGKIHAFAQFCQNEHDEATRVTKAHEMGIAGYPLVVKASERAEAAIKGQRNIFHALCLIPKEDGLYGAACLFNVIWWGFKLSDETCFPQQPQIVVFDVETGDRTGGREFPDVECHDFEFQEQDAHQFMKNSQECFTDAVGICVRMEFAQAIRSVLQPGVLASAFPITSLDEIRNILLERAQLFLGLVMAKYDVPVEFFREKEVKVFSEILVDTAIKHYGQKMQLDHDNYEEIILNLFAISEFLAQNRVMVAFCQMFGRNKK